MKKLGVGVRVRRVREVVSGLAEVGSTGTILAFVPVDCARVKWDRPPIDWPKGVTEVYTDTLEPILDADEKTTQAAKDFVKRVTRPEPVQPAVPARKETVK